MKQQELRSKASKSLFGLSPNLIASPSASPNSNDNTWLDHLGILAGEPQSSPTFGSPWYYVGWWAINYFAYLLMSTFSDLGFQNMLASLVFIMYWHVTNFFFLQNLMHQCPLLNDEFCIHLCEVCCCYHCWIMLFKLWKKQQMLLLSYVSCSKWCNIWTLCTVFKWKRLHSFH